MKMKETIVAIAVIVCSSCTPPVKREVTDEPSMIDTSIPFGVSQTYVGKVGSRSAIFTLKWGQDGSVAGQYNHPDDAGLFYQLKGSNTRNGELVLTEYTAGRQSAIVTLRKSISGSLIQWKGTMHNNDGRLLPVSLTRQTD